MTNRAEAGDPTLIQAGKLYHYARSTMLYKCPTDNGVPSSGGVISTARSYSMNSFMGGRDPSLGPIPELADGFVWFFTKEAEILRPAAEWVFLDEDERSINDGFFITDPTAHLWFDFPAASSRRHRYSFPLSFADGHCEVWRLTDPRTCDLNSNRTEQSGNADLARLAGASTTAK